MKYYSICEECCGTGYKHIGGSPLSEDNYEECPTCNGTGGEYTEVGITTIEYD